MVAAGTSTRRPLASVSLQDGAVLERRAHACGDVVRGRVGLDDDLARQVLNTDRDLHEVPLSSGRERRRSAVLVMSPDDHRPSEGTSRRTIP